MYSMFAFNFTNTNKLEKMMNVLMSILKLSLIFNTFPGVKFTICNKNIYTIHTSKKRDRPPWKGERVKETERERERRS